MRLLKLKSDSTNPYYNLAVEEIVFNKLQTLPNCVLLYTWVNESSVIIGRNQNPYVECNLQEIGKDKVHLVRRKTGGGAVFHDLGNLNYTIIGSGQFAEKDKWNQVICNSVNTYGLCCLSTGRNDFQVNGFKISGSAYLRENDTCLQHGTMMVDVDLDGLKRYLTPDRSKLQRHGVKSVEKRVCNLSALNRDITVPNLEHRIIESMEEQYNGFEFVQLNADSFLEDCDVDSLAKEYSADDFIFGSFESMDQYSDDAL